MKIIHVVSAIIIRDGYILATQRGYGSLKGWWEFPGGKLEACENAHQALTREIREELNIEVNIGQLFDTVEYDYPEFHLSMQCFLCTMGAGELMLREHQNAKWLSEETIYGVEWLPADEDLIGKLQSYLKSKKTAR